MRWLRQVWSVALLNLRTVPERRGASLAAVAGVALVVMVFVAVLSIAEGFRKTMEGTGSADTAVVLRSGSDSEMMSIMGRESAEIIAQGPGVLREGGVPVASAELFVVVDVPKKTTGTPANVPLRGVQPMAARVRDEVKIVSGRMFESGKNELIAGRAAVDQFAGIDVGSVLRWGENEWTVVGVFSAGGTVAESELWCDVRVLQPAYRRGDSFQTVYAKLETPAAFDAFKDALTRDPRLEVQVERETDFYYSQSKTLVGIIRGLGGLIAVLMGVGAVFGAVNTMYSAVAARTREIATLRALGFRAGPVVLSVLAESLALATLGGVFGAVIAYLLFNGYQASTLNWSSFSQVAFTFAVTPGLLVEGVVYALLMGLFGGLLPAIRAARLPVAAALREL